MLKQTKQIWCKKDNRLETMTLDQALSQGYSKEEWDAQPNVNFGQFIDSKLFTMNHLSDIPPCSC